MNKPITQLQVIGVRYTNANFYPGNRIPLDDYSRIRDL